MLKHIILPEALQQEWQRVLTELDDDFAAEFEKVFNKYPTGQALLQALKDSMRAKDGDCLAVHVEGLPEKNGAEVTLNAMQGVIGMSCLMGVEFRNNIGRQGLHKDGYGEPKGANPAVILYGGDRQDNTIPTVLALNDELILAAASHEAAFRKGKDTADFNDKLPPSDAVLETKVMWLKHHMRDAAQMDFDSRESIGGVNYSGSLRVKYSHLDLADLSSVGRYVRELFNNTGVNHDFTVPVYLQKGHALTINNRALVHAQGHGPIPVSGKRDYLRAMLDRPDSKGPEPDWRQITTEELARARRNLDSTR